ncbi:hypothetical protein CCY99_05795 [Helicobacter sp. 16-1353]|uniref:hypothetical protein n=1 Tax=Helicobacter sp. 16-1353 TaxID=2004996 RepID=UPI000DCF40AC|nr:hypothetical protein [Helicobacter sp. 16-1353]RAX53891.1 hypothetical protein CCY99_05795 [Helicobacter sp. 16-1353]
MENTKDNFQKELDEKIIKLQDCQKNKNLDSCLKCENIVGCEIRKDYVDSVYASMNKGSGGFFNFETE